MGLFKQIGAAISNLKQPKFTTLFEDRLLKGLVTQRAVFHDSTDVITSKYYGGGPDAMYQSGSGGTLTSINVELTNDLTIVRAYGTSNWTNSTYPTPPLSAFSFQLEDGTLQVLIDTVGAVYLDYQDDYVITSVLSTVGLTAVYNGTFPGGDNNAYLDHIFNVSGFVVTPTNNGEFICTASTATTLTLSNAFAIAENATAQTGSKELIFTKSAGAGETFFMAIGDVVYMGDGISCTKYTPGNPNGIEWLWGIAAPTVQPSVIITESGAAAVAWQASTVFSTMGLIVDPNGNVQQLYGVNANADNTTQFGVSSDGSPPFLTTTDATTVDGSVTWTCIGPITLWKPATLYSPSQPIYDPRTKAVFQMLHDYAATSGGTYPNLTAPSSQCLIPNTVDGGCRWQCLGVPQKYTPLAQNVETSAIIFPWPRNSPVRHFDQEVVTGNHSVIFYECAMVFPVAPFVTNVIGTGTTLCNGTPVYLFGATSGSDGGGGIAGTTQSVAYTPWAGITAQAFGAITVDNDLQWLCLGPAAWVGGTNYTQFAVGEAGFSAVQDSNGNMQVCIQSGLSGGTTPPWDEGYGGQTTDGGVIWVCVGRSMNWTASTIWYLPVSGFYPPTVSQPYGGAEVISNSFVQSVVSSGLSGLTVPAFSLTLGNYTQDNSSGSPPTGLEWLNIAVASTNSLSWTKGHVYAYSYKCRTVTDYYATNIPPGLSVPNGPYTGGGTGAISTASPVYTIVGANAGAVNTIGGVGSTDPQVDTIVIWRDADGGGSDNMFELTEIPAPPPKANVAQPWKFEDYLPDTPTNLYPGLNILIPAPINDSNDPPPVGFKPMAWHFSRIWGGFSTTVQSSGGPDVVAGNPNEAFNPVDTWPYLSIVTDCIHTPTGLVVVVQTDLEMIYGGPATATFFSTTLFPGKGCLTHNAIDILGGEIHMFTSDSQHIVLSPSLQVSRIGWPIGDKLVDFNAQNAYLSFLDYKLDNAVYLADGATGFFRLNPHQVPQGDAIWSPFRQITGGCRMVKSVVTAPGVTRLLIGSTGNNQHILMRDMTVNSDNGVAYESNCEIGAITLADAGETAHLVWIEMDFVRIGTQPRLFVALDDPTSNPAWVELTDTAYDPPVVYGNTVQPAYYPIRYKFSPTLGVCRRIRLKIEYGDTDTVKNELYGFSIRGKLVADN